MTWGVVAFGAGTILFAPFILSVDAREKVKGGMLLGGVPAALYVTMLVVDERRSARRDDEEQRQRSHPVLKASQYRSGSMIHKNTIQPTPVVRPSATPHQWRQS